jgi:hypothetical protein
MTNEKMEELRGLLAKATPLLNASEARVSVPHTSHHGRRVVGFKIVDSPDHFLSEPLDQLEALEASARALPDLLDTIDRLQSENARMREVLWQYESDLLHPPQDDSRERRIARVREVLASIDRREA